MNNEEQQKLEKQEDKNFKKTAEKNRKKSIKQLVEKMNAEKLRVLQKYLEESNITFDASINDYYKLKKYLKDKLSKEVYATIDDKCKEIDSSFENLINDLSNKSTIGFDKFIKKLSTIVKPVSIGLAFNTALTLAPTLTSKVVIMSISGIYHGYKLLKNRKYRKIITKEGKLNEKLQELEFVYDDNKKLIDTRFSKKDQEIIRRKLKEMNVEFEDTGYKKLRSVIYELDYDKKIEIVLALGGYKNRQELENELNGYSPKAVLKKISSPATTVLSSAALVGLNSLLNGVIVGGIANKLSDNNVLGKIVGSITTFLTLANPENVIVKSQTLILGAVISMFITLIKKIIKIFKTRSKNKKLAKEFSQIENSKYKIDDLKEDEKVREIIVNSKATEQIGELAIIEILTEYIRSDLGVKVTNTPRNIKELGMIIQSLSKKDRHKISKLMQEFDYFNDKPNNQLKRKVEKILKTTGMSIIFGLAGMSAVDIFTGGKFLSDLRDKLFFTDLENIGNITCVSQQDTNASEVTLENYGKFEPTNPSTGEGRLSEYEHTSNQLDSFGAYKSAYRDHTIYKLEEMGYPEDVKEGARTLWKNLNNATLSDYKTLSSIADQMLNSPEVEEKTVIEAFKGFLDDRIFKMEGANLLSYAGSAVIGVSAIKEAADDLKTLKEEDKNNNK